MLALALALALGLSSCWWYGWFRFDLVFEGGVVVRVRIAGAQVMNEATITVWGRWSGKRTATP